MSKKEVQNYKRKVFFTIKQDVLKQVKGQIIDERIAILRTKKFVKLFIIFTQISQNLLKYVEFFQDLKRKKRLERKKIIAAQKIVRIMRMMTRQRYGMFSLIEERIQRRFLIPAMKFSLALNLK